MSTTGLITTLLVSGMAYGLLIGALPVIVANTVTLALALIILVLKLRYG